MVAQIPYILCIHIELLAPVGVDGQVIVVALVEDEADVARKGSFALVVEEFDLSEIHVDIDHFLAVFIGMNQILLILRNFYLVFAAQELDGAVAIHLCFEGVGGTLLLHNVDVVGNHAHADGLSHLEMLVVLNQKFATLVAFGKHLVVYALEDG